ncbi:hypothetical protein ACFU44_00705 [Nocardia rhizosphaerihabitans]|uniref:hypothetical protein n=1 Tax=Nocardia rhizosphaerihabitans TaxID=1691570 RepID=UPI00366AB0D3
MDKLEALISNNNEALINALKMTAVANELFEAGAPPVEVKHATEAAVHFAIIFEKMAPYLANVQSKQGG